MWVFKERSHSWPWTRPPFLWLDNYPSRTVSTPFCSLPPIARTEVTTKSAQPPSNLKEHLLDQEAAEGRSYTFTVRWLQICFSVSRLPPPPHSFFVSFSASEVKGATSTTNQVENPVLKVRLSRIQPRIYSLLGESGKRVRSVGCLIKPTRHLQLISELIRLLTADFTNCSDALLPSVGVPSLGYPIITEGVDCMSHTCSVAVMFEELHRLICLILKLVRLQSCVDQTT